MCSERQAFLCFVGFLTVLQNVVTVEFRSLPFFVRIFSCTQGFVRHVAMVEKDMVTMMLEKRRAREGVSREDEEMFRRLTSRNGLEEQFPKKETRG